MHAKGLKRLGDWIPRETNTFVNRTGAALLRGQTAMLDLLDTQGEVTNDNIGDPLSVWANLTPVTQVSLEQGFPILVCLDESVPDDKPGEFLISGFIEMATVDTDIVGAVAITKGLAVSIVVSASPLGVTGFANGDRFLGISREANAADSTDMDRLLNASLHRRKIWWWGGWPSCNLDA